jgi:quinol monooxygenase YgiN
MAQSTLRAVVRLKAKPDKSGELRSLLAGLLAPTREEPGVISYEMLQNKEDPAEFTFVEEWKDDAAFDAHLETAHIKNAMAAMPELLAEELDLRRYNLVG